MSTPEQPPGGPWQGGGYYPPPPPPYGPPPAGFAPAWPPAPPVQPPRPSSTSAHASIAFGIVALVFCWVPLLGLVLGAAGISLGMKAWRLADLGYDSQRGMGTAGIVLSAVAIGVGLLVIFGLVVSIAAASA